MNAKSIPKGIPTAVINDTIMQSGITIRKTKPIPKHFHAELDKDVIISSVGLGTK